MTIYIGSKESSDNHFLIFLVGASLTSGGFP
jgi:hypothetical protein